MSALDTTDVTQSSLASDDLCIFWRSCSCTATVGLVVIYGLGRGGVDGGTHGVQFPFDEMHLLGFPLLAVGCHCHPRIVVVEEIHGFLERFLPEPRPASGNVQFFSPMPSSVVRKIAMLTVVRLTTSSELKLRKSTLTKLPSPSTVSKEVHLRSMPLTVIGPAVQAGNRLITSLQTNLRRKPFAHVLRSWRGQRKAIIVL